MSDEREQLTSPNPLPDPATRTEQFHRFKRLFAADVLIAGESALGLVIALLALIIATTSMFQSRHANHTAEAANALSEENNRTNKKALAMSEELAAAKSRLTLNAAVSANPTFTLTLKPTSADFVLSDSQIEYMRLFEKPGDGTRLADNNANEMIAAPLTDETEAAGVHDLRQLHYGLKEAIGLAQKRHKWRAKPYYNIDTFDIAGYFPVIIRVDYAYEGHRVRSVFLYEIFYSGWPDDEGPDDKGIDLGKPRLVRSLANGEDPTEILREKFDQWWRESFTEDREPEVVTPMPAASKNKFKRKKTK